MRMGSVNGINCCEGVHVLIESTSQHGDVKVLCPHVKRVGYFRDIGRLSPAVL